jgi:hypothetical protein
MEIGPQDISGHDFLLGFEFQHDWKRQAIAQFMKKLGDAASWGFTKAF